MSGMAMIEIGFVVIVLSTAAAGVAEWVIYKKKKRLREQVYHIYQ